MPDVPVRRLGRLLVALGGNAFSGPDGGATVAAQQAALDEAMAQVAGLVARGWEVILTHGNGPQVGNLLRENELARREVPALPLDWCVAETQATIGFTAVTALEHHLGERGVAKRVACVITRVLVDADDAAWLRPTKPIGPYGSAADAARGRARGEQWADCGARGWRRLVPSPRPRTILDRDVIAGLVESGVVVIAAGGGGIPMTRDASGRLRGVEAVIDKDLAAALLAREIHADCLVIATDVPAAAVHHGTPQEEQLGRVHPARLEALAAAGEFAAGSMGPKVEAALRFVNDGGRRAAISSLGQLAEASQGRAGTVVEPAT